MKYHNGDILVRRDFAYLETDMKNTRRKATPVVPTIAAPRTHVNGSSKDNYVPHWGPQRPGQDDALALPSRMGKRLVYRDGREEVLA